MALPSGSNVAFQPIGGTSVDTGPSTAPSLFIEELTGDKRIIELRERALPYQPFDIEGEMVVETTVYGGNPIATQQPIGSKEGKTTLNGKWKDRFVAARNLSSKSAPFTVNGTPLNSVQDMVQVMDDFRRKGQQVRVTWGHITRVGIITMFRQTWYQLTDVAWSLSFEWASQGEAVPPNVSPGPSINDSAAQARNDAQDVANAANPFGILNVVPPTTPPSPFSSPSDLLSDVYNNVSDVIAVPTDFEQEVSGHMQNIFTAVDTYAQLAASVIDGDGLRDPFLRAVALSSFIVAEANGIEAAVDKRPSIYFFNVQLPSPAQPGPGSLPIASVTSGQMLLAESRARQLRKRARDARLRAADQRAQMQQQAQPSEMLSVFVARDLQDLRHVAVEFYGSQDPWRDLAIYNDLSSSKLSAGTLIFVPKTPPAPSARGIPPSTARSSAANTAGG